LIQTGSLSVLDRFHGMGERSQLGYANYFDITGNNLDFFWRSDSGNSRHGEIKVAQREAFYSAGLAGPSYGRNHFYRFFMRSSKLMVWLVSQNPS
jgi:hypothetical protein